MSAENIEKLKKESTPLGDLKKALIYSHCKEKCGAHFLDLFSVKIINAADKAEIKKIMKAMGPFDKGISELQSVFDIQEAFDFFDVTTKTQLKASWEKMASDVKNLSCFRSFCCNAPFEVCLDSAYALFDILSDLGNNLLDSNVDATKAARHDLYIKIETSLLDFMFDYTKEDTSKSPVKFIREDWNTMLARLMKITYLRKGGDSDRANEIFGVIANPNTLAHVRTNLAARIKFIPGASKKTLESCKPLLDKFDSLLSPVASSVADLVRPSQGGIFDPRSSSVTAKHPSVAANDTELVQMDVQSGRASL
ncbi:MAG: hypothetical protein NTU49_04435 [Gammaproteobacteria bacterium]|nr:hypothetical protein [Gammaproteobacteria bacterium]